MKGEISKKDKIIGVLLITCGTPNCKSIITSTTSIDGGEE